MLEQLLFLIFDFLLIFEVSQLFEASTSVRIKDNGQMKTDLFFEDLMHFRLLVDYIVHTVSGINAQYFSVFRSIDIYTLFYQDGLKPPFGKEWLFLSFDELQYFQNFTYPDGSEIDFIPTYVDEIFFGFILSIKRKRDEKLPFFIKKYNHFRECTHDVDLNYDHFLRDFEELMNLLYLLDSLMIAYLHKVNPESNILKLLRCNQYGIIFTNEHPSLPFHYYYEIDALTLNELFQTVICVNSLNFWKKYNVFQTLLEDYDDYYTETLKRNIIDELGKFLEKFYYRKEFMQIRPKYSYYFAGDSKLNVNITCFDSVFELKSCNGTSQIQEFPSFEKIQIWISFQEQFLEDLDMKWNMQLPE
jgi:hypothetical protein